MFGLMLTGSHYDLSIGIKNGPLGREGQKKTTGPTKQSNFEVVPVIKCPDSGVRSSGTEPGRIV
jgi:hypothetical protein